MIRIVAEGLTRKKRLYIICRTSNLCRCVLLIDVPWHWKPCLPKPLWRKRRQKAIYPQCGCKWQRLIEMYVLRLGPCANKRVAFWHICKEGFQLEQKQHNVYAHICHWIGIRTAAPKDKMVNHTLSNTCMQERTHTHSGQLIFILWLQIDHLHRCKICQRPIVLFQSAYWPR